jgi:hypothetical protein
MLSNHNSTAIAKNMEPIEPLAYTPEEFVVANYRMYVEFPSVVLTDRIWYNVICNYSKRLMRYAIFK